MLPERLTSPFKATIGLHLRRRGGCLLILALLDLGISFGIFTLDNYVDAVRDNYTGHTTFLPLTAWAFIWAFVGTVDLLQAFARYDDRMAFVLSAAIKMAWGVGFFVGWVFFDIHRAWLSALIYVALGSIVLIISGWQENHSTVILLEDAPEKPSFLAEEEK